MNTEFSPALAAVLVHEGGFSNHPRDPGGATMKGVTQRVYDGFRKRHNVAPRSVALISTTEIAAIYRGQYWDAIKGDSLPPGVGYAVFDGAVNSGPAQAVKWLQRALRMNMVDGNLGDATLAAVNAHLDHDRLIADMLALRLAFMKRLKTWDAFGKGWSARVRDVQKRAQAWAMGSVGPEVVFIPGAAGKAHKEDAKAAPSTAPADVAIGGGIATGGAGGALKNAQDTLQPLAGSSDWIATAVAVLAITGVALTLGAIAIRQFQQWRAKQHAEDLA